MSIDNFCTFFYSYSNDINIDYEITQSTAKQTKWFEIYEHTGVCVIGRCLIIDGYRFLFQLPDPRTRVPTICHR